MTGVAMALLTSSLAGPWCGVLNAIPNKKFKKIIAKQILGWSAVCPNDEVKEPRDASQACPAGWALMEALQLSDKQVVVVE